MGGLQLSQHAPESTCILRANTVCKERNSHFVLISCREELQSGEAMNFDCFDLIGR